MHGGNASLDGEVLMDTQDGDGSARDRDRDRDRDKSDEPLVTAPMCMYGEESRLRDERHAEGGDPTATHLADFWGMQLVR